MPRASHRTSSILTCGTSVPRLTKASAIIANSKIVAVILAHHVVTTEAHPTIEALACTIKAGTVPVAVTQAFKRFARCTGVTMLASARALETNAVTTAVQRAHLPFTSRTRKPLCTEAGTINAFTVLAARFLATSGTLLQCTIRRSPASVACAYTTLAVADTVASAVPWTLQVRAVQTVKRWLANTLALHAVTTSKTIIGTTLEITRLSLPPLRTLAGTIDTPAMLVAIVWTFSRTTVLAAPALDTVAEAFAADTTARAIIFACWLAAVSAAPARVALALQLRANTLAATVVGASRRVAVRASEAGIADAFRHTAHALALALLVTIVDAGLLPAVDPLVAVKAFAVSVIDAVAMARAVRNTPDIGAVIAAKASLTLARSFVARTVTSAVMRTRSVLADLPKVALGALAQK